VALNVLDNSLKYYRCSTSLLKWKGDIYFNISKYDSALYCYHGAIICGDSSGSILKSMGICLYWSKKYSSAINFLEHSIELDPKDYVAYFYLGASYKAQNKLDKAMINFKTADTLLQNTFLSNIYNQIGSVYQQQGKYKEAMEYYKAALKENLLDKSNIFYLAAMFDKLKNQKAALNYYKLYLRDSSNQDGKLIDYANKRISELKK
jgi:tetratricopeptide (TPR) repeat protein